MISLYTETLEQFLQNKNYGEELEDSSLTEVLNLMRMFPNFDFQTDLISLDFDMETLFINAYDLREIGSETEEMFLHFWRETTQKLLIKYGPKISMWLEHFNDLFKFTVKLEIQDNENNTNKNKNTYYLNPVTTNTENLKVQDVDKSDSEYHRGRKIERDVLQSVWGKTRANLLQQIMELHDIYLECLYEFDVIFMGVY